MKIRKLASIQKIKSIVPIQGADNVELARVLGWNVVVRKGEFKAGDMVVYFETDSILPDEPEFEFLKNSKGKIKPLKAKKIRGVVSQGLVMPLSAFEGLDLSESIGVIKYEPEEIIFGKSRSAGCPYILGKFPEFIEKTDEPRVQTLLNLEDFIGKDFILTEKIDGTSFTAFIQGDTVGICSRKNLIDMKLPTPYSDVFRKYELNDRLLQFKKCYGENIAIQGEIYGCGIQGNKYKLDEHRLAIFNVINLDTGKQSSPYNAYGLTTLVRMGLSHYRVPLIDFSFTLQKNHTIDVLVESAKGSSRFNSEQNREGIVYRLDDYELEKMNSYNFIGNRFSFKAINPDFLCP